MVSSAELVLPIVVKGYPRLSETFIAQEILELERLGFSVEIWSLRHPTDGAVHMMHKAIRAPLRYLPEYLYQGIGRVLAGLWHGLRQPGLGRFLRACFADLKRDFTPNRARRIGQALVFARECPAAARHVYVHYLHTPCSVVRYAALLTGGSYSFSAHAKDIWAEDRLAIHLQDGCPGKGLMDFPTLFARLGALDPDAPLIAEGNSSEELPEVGALFHRTAKDLGIRILDIGEAA